MQNNESGPLCHVIYKNKFKTEKRHKYWTGFMVIKILEQSTGSNFFDTGPRNISLDMSPEAKEIKMKLNYWDFIKIKSFFMVKGKINKTKKQITEFTNDKTVKGLVLQMTKMLRG